MSGKVLPIFAGLRRLQVLSKCGFQVEILRKRIFRAPSGSRTHDLPDTGLDALTTELWDTRGEQGHELCSYMCDMCPAILQGSTCRNNKCK